jgi:bisphosphoglycerate-dependent phosphoglycerate mutase
VAIIDLKESVQVAIIEAAKEIAINEVKYGKSQGKAISEVFKEAAEAIYQSVIKKG